MTLRADTRLGKLTRSTTERLAVLPAEGTLFLACPFAKGQKVLCCYEEKEPRPGEQEKLCRVELHDLTTKKRRVLLERTGVLPMAFPSPDGKMVALYHGRGERVNLVIFDTAGKKVADVEVE
jgi:hypothetical protein